MALYQEHLYTWECGVLLVSRSCVCAHNRINEFGELSLSNNDAQQDVEAWFEKSLG